MSRYIKGSCRSQAGQVNTRIFIPVRAAYQFAKGTMIAARRKRDFLKYRESPMAIGVKELKRKLAAKRPNRRSAGYACQESCSIASRPNWLQRFEPAGHPGQGEERKMALGSQEGWNESSLPRSPQQRFARKLVSWTERAAHRADGANGARSVKTQPAD
jgi:hypothetical protein